MAMQQSIMEGSLRNTHQRVSLIWKKEISTLERIINYFDHSGEKIELPWDTSKKFYEGTAELTFGKHSGSLFISDQPIEGPLFQVFSFEVNKQNLGVVQEILLQIGTDPFVPSPQPTIKRISSEEMTSSDSALMQPPGDSDEVGTYTHQEPVLTKEPVLTSSLGLAKKDKDRLEGEKRILMDECARVKQEKQKIKEESFEIDEQLICAMEQLSAYERQQALMEERHNALLREARLLEEDNLAMKAVINEKDVKSASDCETIRQLKVDIQFNNDKIEQMREEKERLVAKCNDLEQRCATSEQIEVFKAEEEFEQEKEKKRNKKELAIFRFDYERLREKDIPSLLQDIEELKQQNKATSEQYQNELQVTKSDRDHLQKELQMLRSYLNLGEGEKKPIDQAKISEPETRDSMKLMEQLSRHFEECSNALYKLVQLLEANIDAKEVQLERRMRELREARNRNDSLVQEVFSRGQEINQLTERLKTILTMPVTVTPQSNVVASPGSDLDPETLTKYQNFNPPFPSSPSSSNLETYKPVIKAMYRDLPNVTNTLIDFQKAPTHVMKMTYLEDPQSHIGNQVICMLQENYSVGTLMTVFQYRPSMGGVGTLLPITYAGIQFEEAIGESNGTFKGRVYFTCPADRAEFISVENVYIRV